MEVPNTAERLATCSITRDSQTLGGFVAELRLTPNYDVRRMSEKALLLIDSQDGLTTLPTVSKQPIVPVAVA